MNHNTLTKNIVPFVHDGNCPSDLTYEVEILVPTTASTNFLPTAQLGSDPPDVDFSFNGSEETFGIAVTHVS